MVLMIQLWMEPLILIDCLTYNDWHVDISIWSDVVLIDKFTFRDKKRWSIDRQFDRYWLDGINDTTGNGASHVDRYTAGQITTDTLTY